MTYDLYGFEVSLVLGGYLLFLECFVIFLIFFSKDKDECAETVRKLKETSH